MKKESSISWPGVLAMVVLVLGASFLFVERNDSSGHREEVRSAETILSAVVSSSRFVIVRNPDGISNEHFSLDYGDPCRIDEGGVLNALDEFDNEYLVEYVEAGHHPDGCPIGAVFFFPIKDFGQMTAIYYAEQEDEKRRKAFVDSFYAPEKKKGDAP